MNIFLSYKKFVYIFLTTILLFMVFLFTGKTIAAATFPSITVEFDPSDQSVIVSGMPTYDSSGSIEYELHGYLYYSDERIETFSYGPATYPYHVPDKQAYIFNWSDAEFLLPCSGDYQFTAYVVAINHTSNPPSKEKGPKTTIDITLTKKDESTNWGPGLPNTTVETYDLNQLKGSNKTIRIEEPNYTWTITGTDIQSVPGKNISLAIASDSTDFPTQGVTDFFGDTEAARLSIEHNGEFGFKATLDYAVGTQYAQKYANLFYVVGDGTFTFLESVLVNENGQASFTFSHASNYIIAITDIPYTGQQLNPIPEENVSQTEIDTELLISTQTEVDTNTFSTTETELPTINPENNSTPPATSSFSASYIIILIVIIITIAILFLLKRNKH